MKTFIDLPSGYKYGFPKEIPDDVVDFKKWLIDSGYPEKDIDFAMSHCRMWQEGNSISGHNVNCIEYICTCGS